MGGNNIKKLEILFALAFQETGEGYNENENFNFWNNFVLYAPHFYPKENKLNFIMKQVVVLYF